MEGMQQSRLGHQPAISSREDISVSVGKHFFETKIASKASTSLKNHHRNTETPRSSESEAESPTSICFKVRFLRQQEAYSLIRRSESKEKSWGVERRAGAAEVPSGNAGVENKTSEERAGDGEMKVMVIECAAAVDLVIQC